MGGFFGKGAGGGGLGPREGGGGGGAAILNSEEKSVLFDLSLRSDLTQTMPSDRKLLSVENKVVKLVEEKKKTR